MYTKVKRIGLVEDTLPLSDVKRALGIFDYEEDDELSSITFAAFELAERYCSRLFTRANVTLSRDDGQESFFLPYGEDVVIHSVEVDGVPTDQYKYNDISGKFTVDTFLTYQELRVNYDCGFSTLPHSIDRGIKFLISTILNSGQDFVSGMDVTDMPIRATHLLASEKYYGI